MRVAFKGGAHFCFWNRPDAPGSFENPPLAV
jgi:hypothetical protein